MILWYAHRPATVVQSNMEQVRQEAEEQVAAERAAELSAQAQEYEERIRGLRAQFQQELRRDMRERLMALSGFARPRPEQQPPAGGDA